MLDMHVDARRTAGDYAVWVGLVRFRTGRVPVTEIL
jgi:hypothetical protein